MGLWEEDSRGKVLFPSCHMEGTYCQHGLSQWMVTLITCLRWCLSSFSTAKLLSCPPFHFVSLEESSHAQPILKSEALLSPSLKLEYLRELFEVLCVGSLIIFLVMLSGVCFTLVEVKYLFILDKYIVLDLLNVQNNWSQISILSVQLHSHLSYWVCDNIMSLIPFFLFEHPCLK